MCTACAGRLVLNTDGSLDLARGFCVSITSQRAGVAVRNNVQRGITNRPVDLIATRLSRDLVLPLISERNIDEDVVWIGAGADRQALLRRAAALTVN